MHKCDSCGKLVVNEQDYMCPHCGAVANKHCDHKTHLPDERFNRTGDYNTNSNPVNTTPNRSNPVNTTPHKSKTYDYERVPKTNESQKFDINDLANIQNADDVKKIAKKAFIEQDANGKKKFKPLAIVLIVIFAVNIFGNLLGVAFDAVDSVFEEIAGELPDSWVGYELGEETITHYFTVDTYIKNGSYDKANDCLKFNILEFFFDHNNSADEDYDTLTEEWQSEFTSPKKCFYSEQIVVSVAFLSQEDFADAEKVDNAYDESVTLYGEITSDGVICFYGLNQHLKNIDGKSVYLYVNEISERSENPDTREIFEYYFSVPFNFIKLNSDGSTEFFSVYAYDGEVSTTKIDLDNQYYPDIEELEEYVEYIAFPEVNVNESVPAYGEYTEVVTLVD